MTLSKEQLLNPPLKWVGGKRKLVPTLKELIKDTPYKRLVEPFVGGMSIALGLNPKAALLNDINPHLINFYQHLQEGLVIDLPMEYSPECFTKHKRRFNELTKTPYTREGAGLFYFLSRSGFNGLVRFNLKGEYNVPIGKYKSVNYVTDFTHYKEVIANWAFTCQDFSELKVRPGDLLYIDPPYDVEFTKYAPRDFKWQDQVRLADWLEQYPNPMVASNMATKRVIELYKGKGFTIKEVLAPRNISCKGDRTPVKEVLMFRNLKAD
jgi:DNA adenine methylase